MYRVKFGICKMHMMDEDNYDYDVNWCYSLHTVEFDGNYPDCRWRSVCNPFDWLILLRGIKTIENKIRIFEDAN